MANWEDGLENSRRPRELRSQTDREQAAVMPVDPEEILKTWKPFKEALGVTSVRTEREYARARATMDALLDGIGDDESQPLADARLPGGPDQGI